jgi:prepilin-type N-terminal cleavage/methylation domain-containing protein
MAQARFNSWNSNGGFSLTEVVIAMALLTTVSLGVAQLFAVSTKANLTAKSQTSATAMAEQKLEQLRALTWGFDLTGNGLPVSDTSTNLAVNPPQPNGPGLNPSPSNTLVTNTPGYVDFLDAGGNWLGTGDVPPEGTVYIRRWAVTPLPTNPNNTLILQVLVTPVGNDAARQQNPANRTRLPGDSLLVSVKTRKSI